MSQSFHADDVDDKSSRGERLKRHVVHLRVRHPDKPAESSGDVPVLSFDFKKSKKRNDPANSSHLIV